MKTRSVRRSGAAVGFLLLVLVVALSVFSAWASFWAIGVLFGFHIALTFKTWLAWAVLVAILRGGSSGSK